MFKDNLKKLREEANLTQEELAEKLFVSRSAVAKWEQGRGIPRNETIEEIAKVFNVSINTFYQQDEPQKVIENIERYNKRNIILSYLGSLLVIIILITIVFIIGKRPDHKIEYDVFYSEDTLEGYGLIDFNPITQNSIGSVNMNDNYYVTIDGYETFENYVNYIFEYLQNSPYISYVGFLVERPLEESTYFDRKNYIMKSDNLEDYLTSTYYDYDDKEKNTHYTFYYLPALKDKHKEKDPIDFHFIAVEYQRIINSWIKIGDVEYKTNFKMSIHSTENYGPLGDFYFFHEHFELKKITINQENFYDYFYVGCLSEAGSAWYFISYTDNYYFRAYLPLKLEVGDAENYESKETIVYSPREGNQIKLIRAYGYIDPIDNKLKYRSNVIVQDGYVYRAIPI